MKFFLIFLILFVFKHTSGEKRIEVNHINQREKYPTGCESISTIMALNYSNIDITPEEFIDNYLEKGIFYYKNGQLYAPNPNDKFVGSPYDDNSYGCYEPVIEKALKKLISDRKLDYEVKNLNNIPMDDLIRDYIDNDIPVIFWATMDMDPPGNGNMWIVPETGEKFQWRSNEHCLLLVGYNDDGYYFNDPLKYENHTLYVNKILVEERHKEQYAMAVALVKKN